MNIAVASGKGGTGKTIVEFDGRSEGCRAVREIWENISQRLKN